VELANWWRILLVGFGRTGVAQDNIPENAGGKTIKRLAELFTWLEIAERLGVPQK